MSARAYRHSRRAEGAARTRAAILTAARDLLTTPDATVPSIGAIAARAGFSRLSVYHHFGSKAGLLRELAAAAWSPGGDQTSDEASPRDELRGLIVSACARWAADPMLFRRLPAAAEARDRDRNRDLAARLGQADLLRPGCSLKEAEDVIELLTSFASFDRLHQDGRRSTSTTADILMRMAGAILTGPT